MRWLFLPLLLTACHNDSAEPPVASGPGGAREKAVTEKSVLSFTSGAFADGAAIPVEYTADGADLSPPLAWSGAPEGTAAYVLIVDDPDAPVGTWDHWIVYNLPASVTSLARGASTALPAGARDGKNSWGRTGWGGPAPPPGKPHRYFFKLYALSAPLGLDAGKNKAEVEAAMRGKILGEATWMGTYQR